MRAPTGGFLATRPNACASIAARERCISAPGLPLAKFPKRRKIQCVIRLIYCFPQLTFSPPPSIDRRFREFVQIAGQRFPVRPVNSSRTRDPTLQKVFSMRIPTRLAGIALILLSLSACATRTVVVPKPAYQHAMVKTHVVYHHRPAKRHCWRHNGHWDCR